MSHEFTVNESQAHDPAASRSSALIRGSLGRSNQPLIDVHVDQGLEATPGIEPG
jgi:hypothetical protein